MSELVRLSVMIPKDLRTDFKVICAKKNKDMKDVIKEILEKYIQENEQ